MFWFFSCLCFCFCAIADTQKEASVIMHNFVGEEGKLICHKVVVNKYGFECYKKYHYFCGIIDVKQPSDILILTSIYTTNWNNLYTIIKNFNIVLDINIEKTFYVFNQKSEVSNF